MQYTKLILIVTGLILFACTEEPKQESQTQETAASQKNETKQTSAPPADGAMASLDPMQRLNYYKSEPDFIIDQDKSYSAMIKTNKGDIRVAFDAVAAPFHTNNFVFLARQGFYDGLTFHRHVPNFVIQGGDPSASGTGGPGYTIPAEIGLPHDDGVIAMARQPDQVNPQRRSSGSQFYITLGSQHNLDGGYSVFGRVTEGLDVVNMLTKDDVITTIEIMEN